MMTDEEIDSAIANNYRILVLAVTYEEDFERDLGSKAAVRQFINEILDEILYLKELKATYGSQAED